MLDNINCSLCFKKFGTCKKRKCCNYKCDKYFCDECFHNVDNNIFECDGCDEYYCSDDCADKTKCNTCEDYYCSGCCFYCKICDNYYYYGCLDKTKCGICGVFCCDKCYSDEFNVKRGNINLLIQCTDSYFCKDCEKILHRMLTTSNN